jgi:hypothetical protein
MPGAINAVAGDAAANSYCTLVEATAYNDNHMYGSAWEDASSDDQTRALLTATRLLDEHYAWYGMPTSWSQRLCWPRMGMASPIQSGGTGDSGTIPSQFLGYWGVTLGATIIPERLKDAEAEFARQLLTADRMLDSQIDTQGITSLKAGPVEVAFRTNIGTKPIPDAVSQMLSLWGLLKSDRTMRTLVRA